MGQHALTHDPRDPSKKWPIWATDPWPIDPLPALRDRKRRYLGDRSSWLPSTASALLDTGARCAARHPGWSRGMSDDRSTCDPAEATRRPSTPRCRDPPAYTGRTSYDRTLLTSSRSRDRAGTRSSRWTFRNDSIRPDDRLLLTDR